MHAVDLLSMVQNLRFSVSEKGSNQLVKLNRGQFFWLQLCIHHVLILVMLCTRLSENGKKVSIDSVLSVNYAYQYY